MYVCVRVLCGVLVSVLIVLQQVLLCSVGGQVYVWVIGVDGKVVICMLEVEGSVDCQWLVCFGLKVGEKVVVEGQECLQEGVVVDVCDWQMLVVSVGVVQVGSKG